MKCYLLKVVAAWVTIAIIPGVRPAFFLYGFNMKVDTGQNVMTLTTFISGLIIWNVIGVLGAGLFAFLHNKTKP